MWCITGDVGGELDEARVFPLPPDPTEMGWMLVVHYFFPNVIISGDNSDKNDLLLLGKLHQQQSVTQDIHWRGSLVFLRPNSSLNDTVDNLLDSVEDEEWERAYVEEWYRWWRIGYW